MNSGSPGRTRTADQVVTSALIFLPGLDYLITRPKTGLRVSGASPPGFARRVRAEALVSAPSLNNGNSGLGSGLPFSNFVGGQASLNSPDFSTTISRGSCILQPPALPAELPGKNNMITIYYQNHFAGSIEILMAPVVLCPLSVRGASHFTHFHRDRHLS